MFSDNSWAALKKHLILIYIVFTVVLLGSTALINFSNLSTGMNKEIANSQNLILSQISNTISATMTSIERTLYISSTEESIQTFFENTTKNNANQIISDYTIQNELSQLSKIHNIDSIYLYNKSTEKIISNKNSGDFNTFPDTEWIDYCNLTQDTYSWIGPRTIPSYNETVVSLIRTYPLTASLESAKGFIVLNITDNVLTRPLQNIPHSDSSEFLILDKDNQIIFRNNAAPLLSQDALSDLDFSKSNHLVTKKITGSKNSVFYITNPKTNWKLVSVCTYNNLIKSITTIKYYFIIVFLGMLLILILGISFLSRWMYSPIDNLINSIAHRLTKSGSQISLKEIEDIFHYTHQRNEKLNKQIQESLPGIKWKLINAILSSSYKDFRSLQYELEAINYALYDSNLAVILMDIDELNNLNATPDEIDLYLSTLSDTAEKKFNQTGLAISSKIQANRVIVITSFAADTPDISGCIATTGLIQDFMHDCFHITITAAVSDFVESYSSLPEAFYQATELLRYKAIIGYNSILTPDSIKVSGEQNITALNTLLEKLDQVLQNAPRQCFTIIDQMFDQIIVQTLPYDLITHISMQILVLGIRRIGTNNIQEKTFDNEQYKNLLSSLTQYETVPELKQIIIDMFNELLAQYENHRKSLNKSNDELIETVIQYIMQNYNHDLSMSMLSDKFAISQSYLSKLLKDYSGKSFMELLIETRLKNAELMLRTTNLKVSEIAAKVGYGNLTSFVRVFKKYYYLKPSEYRNKYILNQDASENTPAK